MPTLHLMVGLPCAGKTTLARQLEERYSALRLTPDEWQTGLFGDDALQAAHDERHSAIEALLWKIAARVLRLGVDVILDFGFWAAEEREDYRARARQLGAASEVHYLEVPAAELIERVGRRNAQLAPGEFTIDLGKLREWIIFFQPPTADEQERREA